MDLLELEGMEAFVLERMRELGVKLSFREIVGKRRNREVTMIRHRLMWELRQQGFSYPKIGLVFNKHHTSVLHAVKQVDRLLGGRPLDLGADYESHLIEDPRMSRLLDD